MVQRMLAIWSLVPLPFLKPAWTSGSSRFTYCWSLAWRILSITLLACEMSALRSHKSKKEFGLFLKSKGELYSSVNTCALVSSVCNWQPFIKARRWRDSSHKTVWTSTRTIEFRIRGLPPSCCSCATWSKLIKPLSATASSVVVLFSH